MISIECLILNEVAKCFFCMLCGICCIAVFHKRTTFNVEIPDDVYCPSVSSHWYIEFPIARLVKKTFPPNSINSHDTSLLPSTTSAASSGFFVFFHKPATESPTSSSSWYWNGSRWTHIAMAGMPSLSIVCYLIVEESCHIIAFMLHED